MIAEQINNLRTFAGAHHAGIDINTGQLIPDRFMQENGGDRGVNAAR